MAVAALAAPMLTGGLLWAAPSVAMSAAASAATTTTVRYQIGCEMGPIHNYPMTGRATSTFPTSAGPATKIHGTDVELTFVMAARWSTEIYDLGGRTYGGSMTLFDLNSSDGTPKTLNAVGAKGVPFAKGAIHKGLALVAKTAAVFTTGAITLGAPGTETITMSTSQPKLNIYDAKGTLVTTIRAYCSPSQTNTVIGTTTVS